MKAKKMNLRWIKAVVTLIMIVTIYKIMSRLDVYAIACSLLVVVLVLSISYARNQSKKDMEMMRKPNPIQFQYTPRQRKKFNALKLEQLRKMNPYQFEEYIAWIYRCLGYSDAKATKGSSDGGKDVVFTDPATGKKCYSECKRFAANNVISRPIVQKLVGSALADNAIPYAVFTTGRFTNEALVEAKKTGVRCIGPRELLEMIELTEQKENQLEDSTELNTSISK